ncbi:MAG: DeoR/GlpR family DNA-binding transcription regulator [Firmicutes bacterium]|nr:DeoR/GlpR family DNA-binding transcription regulator [Bacillota bacterium]
MVLAEQRRREIVQLARGNSFLSIASLSSRFGVSEMTIRRDLDWLSRTGRLHRVRGGAVISDDQLAEPAYSEKQRQSVDRKSAIARRAAELIRPDDALLLTTGTTIRLIAERMKNLQGITVVTNGIDIASELAPCTGIRTIILGGDVRRSYAVVGLAAERDLDAVHYVDKLFMGVDGISSSHGLTTHHPMEARLYHQMMKKANQVIVVADSSKVGKSTFSFINDVGEADLLITNADADASECERLRSLGLEIDSV